MKIALFSLFLSFSVGAQGILSLRRNKEILRTYEELTGIKTDKEIKTVYDASFISLPKNGDVSELSGFTLISMMNLSQLFCQKLVAKERTLRPESRWVLNRLDLEKDVSTWSEADIEELDQSLAALFWNRTPDAETLIDLKSVFKYTSRFEQPLAQSAAVEFTCTAMLMSPFVYTK